MKKRILSIALVVVLTVALLATVAFAAKRDPIPTTDVKCYPHGNALKYYEEKLPTCTEAGHKEYFGSEVEGACDCAYKVQPDGTCDPEDWFDDKSANADDRLTLPVDPNAHGTPRTYPAKIYLAEEATCTSGAKFYKSCPICQAALKDLPTFVSGDPVAHTPQNYPAAKHLKEAGNCVHGDIYYQSCKVCNETLKDLPTFEKGTAPGHKVVTYPAKAYLAEAATCTTPAKYYKSCSVCKEALKDLPTFESGEALGHKARTYPAAKYLAEAATCTTPAKYYQSCSVCQEALKDLPIFESGKALGHKARTYPAEKYLAAAATCTEPAKYYQSCSVCQEALKDLPTFTSGDPLGHTAQKLVDAKHLKDAATCTTSAVYYQSCKVCNETLKDLPTFTSGDPLGHTPEEAAEEKHLKDAATCTTSAVYYQSCAVCDETLVDLPTFEYGDPLGHTPEDAVEEKHLKDAATCTTSAVYYQSCAVCDETLVDLPAFTSGDPLGHDWTASWKWIYKGVTYDAELTLTCLRDASHVETPEVTVTVTYKAPTYVSEGLTTYTATATASDGREFTDVKEIVIPKVNANGYYQYVLNFDTNGGTLLSAAHFDKNVKNTRIYLSNFGVPKRAGYTFAGWFADAKLTKPVNFVVFTANNQQIITVYAGWTVNGACTACACYDVAQTAWYHDYVRFVLDYQLMEAPGGWFDPNEKMTREQLVRAMYAVAGAPYVEYKGVFTDVPRAANFAAAVEWAAANGIVNGVGNKKFDPYAEVTREQIAAIFFRFATYVEKSGANTLARTAFDWTYTTDLAFKDGAKVSSWAVDAVAWCVENGLLYGDNKGNVNPQGNTTRAEGAAILTRFCK